jgi:Fe2+ transport system protein FeoA
MEGYHMKQSLYEAKPGKEYTIVRTPDFRLLSSIGLFNGAKVKMESKYALGGPVSVSLSTKKIAVGKDLATQIYVREVR